MVQEADAVALVADVAQALAARGYHPVIPAGGEVRLVRYAVLMLDGFGIGGREATEENDGCGTV